MSEKKPYTPNIRHLNALLVVAKSGSISAAAKATHLSQPAISQGLAKIEQHLKTPLFERDSRGMYATDAGKVFLSRVARGMDMLNSLDKELQKRPATRPITQLFTSAQLRAVIAVVEQSSLTLAAAALNLAQPTVQRAAREAEQICGSPLFIRSANGVDPTALARRLARVANLLFSELQQGREEVDELLGHLRGKLCIGSLPLARTQLIPNTVTTLLQEFPEAEVSIIDGPYDQLLDALLHSRIDVIVGALRQPPPVRDIQQTLLFEDPLAIIVRTSHPLTSKLTKAKLNKTLLRELAQLDWIAPRRETPARLRFNRLFESYGLKPPQRVIECSSSVATRGLLLQSNRAALLSAHQVQTEIHAKLLATLPINLHIARPIGLSQRKNWRPTSIQQRFLSLLEAEVSKTVVGSGNH